MNQEQLEALHKIMQTCADVRNNNITSVIVTTPNQSGEPQNRELTKEEWLMEFFEDIENLIGENFDIISK